MSNRKIVLPLVGMVVLCLIITAYSVGRMNGREQAQKAGVALTPEEKARQSIVKRQATQAEFTQLAPAQASENEQKLATADVKMIGTSLLMYVQDYDETFPPRDDAAGFTQRVGPYLKETKTLEAHDGVSAFEYTFNKTSLASIATPDTLPIGHKDTRDGRAQLYADGHVRWETLPNAAISAPVLSP